MDKPKYAVNSIVVRSTNWIGDAMMSIPALRALRRVFPSAEITLCTRSWAKGLFEKADFIDQILVYEKGTLLEQARIWRERKFDLAILLTNSFDSALLARVGRAARSFGYATEMRGFLLTDPVTVPEWKRSKHEVYYYLSLIEHIEQAYFGTTRASSGDPDYLLLTGNSDRDLARDYLSQKGIDLAQPVVAFCPGSTNSRAKRWPSKYYADLGVKLIEKGAQVVLIGSKDERAVAREVQDTMEKAALDLTGEVLLEDLPGILAACDLLVTNDTGPSHIAPAVGTKTLVVFGPTDPTTTRPFPPSAVVLREPPDCAPCMLRDCPIDHRCMTAISPDRVFSKAMELING